MALHPPTPETDAELHALDRDVLMAILAKLERIEALIDRVMELPIVRMWLRGLNGR